MCEVPAIGVAGNRFTRQRSRPELFTCAGCRRLFTITSGTANRANGFRDAAMASSINETTRDQLLTISKLKA